MLNLNSSIVSINICLKDFENLFENLTNNQTRFLKIYLPINGVYDAKLIEPVKNKTITKIRFDTSDTFYENPNQTQIYCIGNNVNYRWCRAKNMGMIGKNFVIFSLYNIKIIPKNVLRISSRKLIDHNPILWRSKATKIYKKIALLKNHQFK